MSIMRTFHTLLYFFALSFVVLAQHQAPEQLDEALSELNSLSQTLINIRSALSKAKYYGEAVHKAFADARPADSIRSVISQIGSLETVIPEAYPDRSSRQSQSQPQPSQQNTGHYYSNPPSYTPSRGR
ncbi:hypothetical protein CSKR_108631 [Clonorchis sinensis]|uniref:Uncharacterized protein n=1 Tax=Clonorchis sinensis TaxID=79923 RepID=A0A8T1MEI5_CLOSI|nr:hypothetical protein CSKR_108631 [Clonorchis sinensis]